MVDSFKRMTKLDQILFILLALTPILVLPFSANILPDHGQRSVDDCDDNTGESPKEKEHKENSEMASAIAQNAAESAKEDADIQDKASAEAAMKVKADLAERAQEAARSAQAALAGKQATVDEIEHQIMEAEKSIKEQTESMKRNAENVKIAANAVQQTEQLIKTLQSALQMAQDVAQSAQGAVDGAKSEYNHKCEVLEDTKKKVLKLQQELKLAKDDLECTMDAAKKAVSAAKNAQNNVAATPKPKTRRRRKFDSILNK